MSEEQCKYCSNEFYKNGFGYRMRGISDGGQPICWDCIYSVMDDILLKRKLKLFEASGVPKERE